jgi:mRNA interferase MazF
MGMGVGRFEVYLVNLDPTLGSEVRKLRPCVIVSPDELNGKLRTVVIAPMTTRLRGYASRVPCRFKGKAGQVLLDQIRAIDKLRLTSKLGQIDKATAAAVLAVLQAMFAP